MVDYIEVMIENRVVTDRKWTTFEGKLPEGVYILRGKDVKGQWFDLKARFEISKGWKEDTAEEWANKRRPHHTTDIAKQVLDLGQLLGEMPKLPLEEIEAREEARRKEILLSQQKRRFSLKSIFGLQEKKDDKILERMKPADVKLNHIYNGDCISVMKQLPSNFFDAIITDPPYNLGKKYKSGINDAMRAKDYYEWSYKWIDESARILKPHGQLFIALWDTYKYHIKVYIDERWGHKLRFVEEIAWETTGVPRPGSGKLRSDITPWLHFGPTRRSGESAINYTHNVDKVRSWKFVKHKDVKKKVGRYVHPLGKDPGTLWRFFRDDEWESSVAQNFYMLNWFRKFVEHVLDYSVEHGIQIFDVPSNIITKRNLPGTHRDRLDHPCQMPVEVPQRLVRLACNPGDTIFEPFMGTGTTAHAAMLEGVNCVGTELSPDYTLMARDRLRRARIVVDAAVEHWNGKPPEWTSDPCTPQFTDPGEKSLLDFFAIGAAGAKRLGEDLIEDISREMMTGVFEL